MGLGLFLYPYISQWFYERNVNDIDISFDRDVAENNQRLEALYQYLLAENQRVFVEGQKNLMDPFSYETAGIDLREYGISDNIIGTISIPKIDETLPIYLGANDANMKKGAVHLTETSYPVGGENTHSVIAAHRGYHGAKMLRNIDELEVGDQIVIKNFRETLTYEVAEIKIINPNEIEQVLIQPGKDMVTLMSCHPYTKSTYRYLVYCERVQ